jgi:nucleoid-associated protein YgaU
MGLFDFARSAGEKLRNTIGGGKDDVSAQELADKLKAGGITLRNGQVTLAGSTVTVSGEAGSQADREKIVLILGNTEGVDKVDDRMTIKAAAPAQATAAPTAGQAAQTAAEPQFYEVKSGDTLSKVAKAFYGDANRYHEIFEANKPMLKDPDEIYPGQRLRIPKNQA